MDWYGSDGTVGKPCAEGREELPEGGEIHAVPPMKTEGRFLS